jgi:hypothetical protein
MSRLTVSRIDTENSTTPLTITTGNNSSGFIKVETANDQVVFSGTARFITTPVGLAPTAAFTTANLAFSQANLALTTANSAFANSSGTFSGNLTTTGTLSDSKGNVRDIPVFTQASAYGLTINDTGRTLSTTSTVFVPSAVFSAGQAITIYNNSASSITVTQNSSVTMYLSGTATTGNRTLAQRGVATLLCVAANTFVISGAGLT